MSIPITELLAFQAAHPNHTPAVGELIRATFGVSPARFYHQLNRAIDKREALEHDPILVKRLRRIRDARTAERARRVSRSA